MKTTPSPPILWGERVPLLNRWSVPTVAAIPVAAALCVYLSAPSSGASFGLSIAACIAAYLLTALSLCSVTVTAREISVGIFPYRKRVPMRDAIPGLARTLSRDDPLRLRWRKNGIGLPGAQLGWFSTSSKRPVFAATAGKNGRVLIPTRTGHDLIVSSRTPDQLVAVLQAIGTATAAGDGLTASAPSPTGTASTAAN